jgi:S-DNA-T family DNA segregation ATPase FtsK/SpoIIIE
VAKPIDRKLVEKGGETLEATLLEFGVDAHLVGMTIGPTVTRYELELGPGVKVNKVTSLSHDIAYAMASPDVRIIAPIPGRSAIGVEVPNRQRQLVNLGDILVAEEGAKPAAVHPLEVGLGRDIAGRPFSVNLATMPHLLIAGATGAGKSSCINSLITSILMRATPDQVRMILIDPKRVELGQYNDVPHLLTPVVVNPKKAANALDWAVREMELRYDLLAEVGVRDITGYNAAFDRGDLNRDPLEGGTNYERLPFIVVVVDELADLMMVAARDVETSICRIAQMARAVGIHLVIATQRPSVDVITGVIKANVPSRLAFSVSSLADSRVILDTAGAEKLIGKGDMLLLTASSSRPARIQGAWVEESDVHKVVAHWRRQTKELHYVEAIQGDGAEGGSAGGGDPEDSDDLLDEAMELIVRSGLGSTSMLQRKLRVGFSRAGRLMDLLERRGVVGPSEGSKARAVLMTVEELEALPNR